MTIRRTPEDFRVEERHTDAFLGSLTPERIPSHPFAAYTLEKISLATPDALGFISNALDVPRPAISAAGLKDRHAVTSQVITIDCAALRSHPPRHAEDPAWRLTRIGFVPRAADANIIARNAFTIVVRGLEKRPFDELASRSSLLVDAASRGPVPELLFVN